MKRKQQSSIEVLERGCGIRTSSVEWSTSHYDLDVAFPARLGHNWSSSSLVSPVGSSLASRIVCVCLYVCKERG